MFEGEEWEEPEVEGSCAGGVSAASMALSFLLKQSYICALMAMMAWSITYVSWLTCVLLLWSCVLWMLRERRRYTLASSPWLVVYGNLLVLLQYIYSFQKVQEVPGLFPRKDDPCVELASKVLRRQHCCRTAAASAGLQTVLLLVLKNCQQYDCFHFSTAAVLLNRLEHCQLSIYSY